MSQVDLMVAPADHPDSLVETKILNILEDNIELLSEAEHNGFMEQKYRDGYVFGTQRDKGKKIHDTLVAYGNLSEENKDKDRSAIRNYPKIVKMAGFKIVLKT